MEIIRRFLNRKVITPNLSSETNHLSHLEQQAIEIPILPFNQKGMNIAQRELKWREWAEKFLPLYALSDNDTRKKAHDTLLRHRPLEIIDSLVATWEVGEHSQYKELVPKFFKEIATCFVTQKESGFSRDQLDFLLYLNNRSSIPGDLKKDFPKPSERKDNTFNVIQSETTSHIILSRLLNSDFPDDDTQTLMVLLERIAKDEMRLPSESKFTRQVLRKYRGSRGVRKLLKEIHESHSEWAKKQSRDWRGRKRL